MDSPAARTTSMASMTRESSPPLAIRPMSSGTDESWAAKVIRTSSAPWAAGSRAVISKATLALGMDRAASSSLTAAENSSAVRVRISVSSEAAASRVGRGSSASAAGASRARASAARAVECGVETVEVAVLGFEFGQFGCGSGLEVEHFGHVLTVGGECSEFGAAGLGLLQGGLGEFVEAREVGGQFGGGVRQPQHRIAER